MARVTRIKLSKDPLGYWFEDEFIEGLAPDERLTAPERRRVISWANTFDPENAPPRELPPTPPKSKLREQEAALGDFRLHPFWKLLTDDQREVVNHPEQTIGESYPLSIGKLADLTDTSVQQVRHWNDSGLIPARRTKGGHREFFGASAAKVLVLSGLDSKKISVLREFQKDKDSLTPLLVLLAEMIAENTPSHTGALLSNIEAPGDGVDFVLRIPSNAA